MNKYLMNKLKMKMINLKSKRKEMMKK